VNLIDKPGVYQIAESDYHRKELCIGPSISSSGLRAIAKCPAKYWWNSPLNPNRPEESEARHFTFGRAAHDLVLDGVGWPSRYHVLPEGFNAGHTKKWADAIDSKTLAELAGLTVLRHDDWLTIKAMAAELKKHPISKALSRGKAEQSIVWKDAETGVWLRCRPDFLPDNRRLVPDYKTTIDAHPDSFAKDVASYGYHQQAALYLDGLAAVFGEDQRAFYFIAQEKTAPFIVQPFTLDEEAIAWGRKLNRKAIRTFAECLEKNEWPGYATDFVTVALPQWQVKQLRDAEQGEIIDRAGETNEALI